MERHAAAERLAPVLDRNIRALLQRRRGEEREKGWEERLADRVTRFTGSMAFVYIHLVLFGTWIAWNVPGSPLPRFDPSLVILAMAASVEAIFLSTFILISQNRMQAQADRRADLDLQVNLLAEHEVTQLIRLTRSIARRLGIQESESAHLEELERDVRPERVLQDIERVEQEASDGSGEEAGRDHQ